MVRGPVSMVIVGFISLVMFALVSGGPRIFENVLPESAIEWLSNFGMGDQMASFAIGGSSKTVAAPASESAQAHLADRKDGWEPSNKIAAMPGNRAVFVSDVISGRSLRIEGDYPAQVTELVPLDGCIFTPPSPEAFVGHIAGRWPSNLTLALATYGDEELAAAVEDLAKTYRAQGRPRISGLDAISFSAFDVAVTETVKPVYLVLQSTDDYRLWNLHLAPGARLERVVLLGGTEVGVANLPPGVPVEVLRTAEAEACAIPRPFYPLNPNFLLFQSLEAGVLDPAEAQETLDGIAAQGKTYDRWFRKTFGVSADETMAGNWNRATIAVAGPLPTNPDARAIWQPITGSTAQITFDTYVEYPALTETGVDFGSRVLAIATAYAWGDLANLEFGEDL